MRAAAVAGGAFVSWCSACGAAGSAAAGHTSGTAVFLVLGLCALAVAIRAGQVKP